jgi:hypothetical protein
MVNKPAEVGNSSSEINNTQSNYNTRKTFNKNISRIVRNMRSNQLRPIHSSTSPPNYFSEKTKSKSSDSSLFFDENQNKENSKQLRKSSKNKKTYQDNEKKQSGEESDGEEKNISKSQNLRSTQISLRNLEQPTKIDEPKTKNDEKKKSTKNKMSEGNENIVNNSNPRKQKSKKKTANQIVITENSSFNEQVVSLFLSGVLPGAFETLLKSYSTLASSIQSFPTFKSINISPFDYESPMFNYKTFLTTLFTACAMIIFPEKVNDNSITSEDLFQVFPHLPLLLHMKHPFQHLPHFYVSNSRTNLNKHNASPPINFPLFFFKPLRFFVSYLQKLRRDTRKFLQESLAKWPIQAEAEGKVLLLLMVWIHILLF